MDIILRTEKLCKFYGEGENEVRAIDNTDIEIEKGEFVAIVGKSGSGKSTLLHMLGGLDIPTSGKVFIGNKDIFELKEEELAVFRRRKIGFIFQAFNLVASLNVWENIVLPMGLDGKEVDEAFIKDILNTLQLENKIENLPNTLSGGQQQRVAIARSLIYRPDLLLADEPTGNLDRQNSREVIDMLKLSNRNMHQTILLITHDEKTALEADRVVMIEDGRIISDVRREGKTLSDTRQG